MANPNRPFGLAPIRHRGGSEYDAALTRYYVPSTDGSAFYIGDLVLSAANGDANGVPAVAKAASTDTCRGVFVGKELSGSNQPSIQGVLLDNTNTYIPATKTVGYYLFVQDDPECMFAIQGDATATNQVATSCNKNCTVTVTAGASGQSASATVVASAGIATTQGLLLKLHGLHQVPGNAFGAYAIWNCYINQHELMGNTAGV